MAVEPVDYPGVPVEMHRHRLLKHPPIPARTLPVGSPGGAKEAPVDLPRPSSRRR